MKKVGKKILIGIGILLALFIILVIAIIIDTNKQENLLDKEINNILNLSLLENEVDTTIVTHDEYAVIEKTIKEYVKDYSNQYKVFYNAINNFDFTGMFTIETFLTDGPDFIQSKGSLSQLKNTVNDSLSKIIEMSNKEYIMGLIEKEELDEYYLDLYKSYMFGNDINSFNDTISETVAEIEILNENVNAFLDDCYKMYDFLSENRNYWVIENGVIYFSNDNLIEEYNSLINKIIESSDKLANYESTTMGTESV